MSISTCAQSAPLEHKVLDEGFIRVVDCMGGDNSIVQMARVSYGAGTKTVREDRGLIRYLLRNKHMSPFQAPSIMLHIKLPIFVANQFKRHHMEALNEYSGRYSEMSEDFYMPKVLHSQGAGNKQKSGEPIEDQEETLDEMRACMEYSTNEYRWMLEDPGLSREEARIVLPLATYTEMYVRMNLRSLLHFIELRLDQHAQFEIQEYARALSQIVQEWCPLTYEAFKEYVMEAITLSGGQVALLKDLLLEATGRGEVKSLEDYGLTQSEVDAMLSRLSPRRSPPKACDARKEELSELSIR